LNADHAVVDFRQMRFQAHLDIVKFGVVQVPGQRG
jgi:hypothetical protein